MEIRTRVHTIFMMVGATESGKSTFAKKILMPQLRYEEESKNFRTNIQYISSDEIRQDLLGFPYDKHAQVMMESSQQAFTLLFEKLKAVTSFPIHTEFVIVDTTGLSEEFREQVAEIARQNHYNLEIILFDYKNNDDYYLANTSKKLIANHVSRLRREVLGKLQRGNVQQIHRIRHKNFYHPETDEVNPDYQVIVENMDEYLAHFLPLQYKYIIVGDVHERVEELKKLLLGHGFQIDGGKITTTDKTSAYRVLLVGDWIDKGGQTKEIIRFISDNIEWFYLVKGNHENFVSKYLQGEISETNLDGEFIRHYFDSIHVLKQDEELKQDFLSLVGQSKEFFRLVGINQSSFYVSHAPCQNKYLGKLDKISRKHQRRFATDFGHPLEEQLAFIQEESMGNAPYHVFGHIAAKDIIRVKNKIGIDTGCVQGNQLTSIMLDSWKPFFRTQRSEAAGAADKEPLPSMFKRKQAGISLEDLDESDKKRLNYVLRHKINFISGTMSPADKDEEADDLESLRKGLQYFKNKGIKKVVLQPKYMGSRCNIYLHASLEQCFAVSRNGYKVNQVDLTPVFEKLLGQFRDYMSQHEIAMMILDGELLPWRVMGEGLIERQFKTIEKALETELEFLKQNGFEKQMQTLVEAYQTSGFAKEQSQMPKKELIQKYGDAAYQNFKQVHEWIGSYYPLAKHQEAYEKYSQQLELYGQEGDLVFKPFAILKVIKTNGEEEILSMQASDMFAFLSEDEISVIDFEEENYEEKAETYYRTLTTERKMEGVVIKPEIPKKDVAPYMKVRNPDYLTIIYGYDYRFPHKYKKLVKQKSIGQKLKTSIAEYTLGQEMLSFPWDRIGIENEEYKQVVANMLFETSKEKEIDPRL